MYLKNNFYYFILILFGLVSITACGGDDNEDSPLRNEPITAVCGSTHDISAWGSNFTSANSFVASVKDNTLKAEHIGETTISNGKSNVKVTINGKIKYIDEPCRKWGASISEVRSLHKVGEELQGGSDSNLILYTVTVGGKYKYIYGYSFENSKLKASVVYVPVSEASTLVDWLAERFFLMPISSSTNIAAGGMNSFDNDKATELCAISADTTFDGPMMYSKYNYAVLFLPSSKSSTRATNNADKDILEQFSKGLSNLK